MVHGSLDTVTSLLQTPLQGRAASSSFSQISTDTRQLRPGAIFVALQGERFDGHDFIPQALAQGAVAVIASQPIAAPHWQVKDPVLAYQQLATWWRSQFAIPVIGITGSAGKTSTKEMLAAALSRYGRVLKSQANHNNDIGVAQTLLQLEPEHEFVVLEMAMRGSGEIARLAHTARPTHALLTMIGTAHIERLGSREAIAAAKCELLANLDPAGVAILNGEDELMLRTARPIWQGKTLTFGLERGDVKGSWDPQVQTVMVADRILPVPLAGRHHALNWLAVVATIQSLGLDLDRLQDPISLPADVKGRNQQLTLPGDVVILDETYNAAPEAMIAALHLLQQTPGQRRWAILGPMRELGSFAPELYAEVGRVAASLDLHRILLLDPTGEMDPVASQIGSERCQTFRTDLELLNCLRSQVQPGDRLLFKAARAVALETVLDQFVQDWVRFNPSNLSPNTAQHSP